jgi:AcrR family transcriptional regulator
MRVTGEVKQRTHARLLAVGRKLLGAKGLDGMTTREVAVAAGLAHGTLFNYFPTKEALALAICHELLTEAQAAFEKQRRGDEELEEELFAHVVAGLHALAPFRTTAGPLLAAALRPGLGPQGPLPAVSIATSKAGGSASTARAAARKSAERMADARIAASTGADSSPAAAQADADSAAASDPYALQARHLQTVASLIARHRGAAAGGPVALHLYWSLYLGVLAWWSADASPHQEDTLAVLDQSLRMFTASLGAPAPASRKEPRHGS